MGGETPMQTRTGKGENVRRRELSRDFYLPPHHKNKREINIEESLLWTAFAPPDKRVEGDGERRGGRKGKEEREREGGRGRSNRAAQKGRENK
jgi:hypothetical protein